MGSQPMHWTPPQTGILKLNVVVVANFSENKLGAGCILRGDNGSVFLSAAVPMSGFSMPIVALLRAISMSVVCVMVTGF